jgi:hypothetical protein
MCVVYLVVQITELSRLIFIYFILGLTFLKFIDQEPIKIIIFHKFLIRDNIISVLAKERALGATLPQRRTQNGS